MYPVNVDKVEQGEHVRELTRQEREKLERQRRMRIVAIVLTILGVLFVLIGVTNGAVLWRKSLQNYEQSDRQDIVFGDYQEHEVTDTVAEGVAEVAKKVTAELEGSEVKAASEAGKKEAEKTAKEVTSAAEKSKEETASTADQVAKAITDKVDESLEPSTIVDEAAIAKIKAETERLVNEAAKQTADAIMKNNDELKIRGHLQDAVTKATEAEAKLNSAVEALKKLLIADAANDEMQSLKERLETVSKSAHKIGDQQVVQKSAELVGVVTNVVEWGSGLVKSLADAQAAAEKIRDGADNENKKAREEAAKDRKRSLETGEEPTQAIQEKADKAGQKHDTARKVVSDINDAAKIASEISKLSAKAASYKPKL